MEGCNKQSSSQGRGGAPPGCMELQEGQLAGGILPATLMTCFHFRFQIRRHPSFKRFFYEFSDSSLSKLVATLRSQVAHSSKLDRNRARRLYQFDVSLANKFAGNNSHAMCILMGLRDHYNCTRFPYREDQPVREGREDNGDVA